MKTASYLLLATVISSPLCHAEKAAELKPSATPGKLLVDESFNESALSKKWNTAKGDWHVVDGALVGKEKASDKHAAVTMLAVPNKNSILKFSLKMDGSEGFSLSLNKEKAHLFRLNVSGTSITLMKDKDKKDPKSKGGKLAGAEAKFEKGKWYTILMEIDGAKVNVQTDNGAKLSGNDPELDVAKTGYRFVTKGESVMVDDIKAWDIAP
ncbi:MAG: hypothetical protein JWO08_4741 [Verrucomicrobiaceae bacterium]|nr:hypothetical protein [Verrucomicrobiaceae bacterium]